MIRILRCLQVHIPVTSASPEIRQQSWSPKDISPVQFHMFDFLGVSNADNSLSVVGVLRQAWCLSYGGNCFSNWVSNRSNLYTNSLFADLQMVIVILSCSRFQRSSSSWMLDHGCVPLGGQEGTTSKIGCHLGGIKRSRFNLRKKPKTSSPNSRRTARTDGYHQKVSFLVPFISFEVAIQMSDICPWSIRPDSFWCFSFITSIRQIRLAYGKPYPYIFWVGFGRTKCGSYSPDLLRWMEKIDTLLTKAVRRQSWPEWLHYTPLVVIHFCTRPPSYSPSHSLVVRNESTSYSLRCFRDPQWRNQSANTTHRLISCIGPAMKPDSSQSLLEIKWTTSCSPTLTLFNNRSTRNFLIASLLHFVIKTFT